MTKFRSRWIRSVFLAGVAIIAAPLAFADDYREARAELVAAYQAQEFDKMVVAAGKSLKARPGNPGALFNLALAHALNDDPAASLQTLELLLAKGIDFGADEMDEFAALRTLPEWAAYTRGIAALYEPVGSASVALRLDDGHFVPEGIAIDALGNVYLGSIHKGELRRNADVLSSRQGHWSIFGMRFHSDGNLWFASSAVAQLENVGDEIGKAGLFRLNVESGEVDREAILPQYADEQVLGDLVIDGDVIYTTDSITGAVYRYDTETDEYSALVDRGVFGSPQGLVLDATGDNLYVADYIGGVYRVSLPDGEPQKLRNNSDATDYGIDGLYRYGDELIAIQNGMRPHRVVALQLSDDGLVIRGSRMLAANLEAFDEPTLGVVEGDDFYFVANSHWNRFDAENRLPDGLSGPIILKLSLHVE